MATAKQGTNWKWSPHENMLHPAMVHDSSHSLDSATRNKEECKTERGLTVIRFFLKISPRPKAPGQKDKISSNHNALASFLSSSHILVHYVYHAPLLHVWTRKTSRGRSLVSRIVTDALRVHDIAPCRLWRHLKSQEVTLCVWRSPFTCWIFSYMYIKNVTRPLRFDLNNMKTWKWIRLLHKFH